MEKWEWSYSFSLLPIFIIEEKRNNPSTIFPPLVFLNPSREKQQKEDKNIFFFPSFKIPKKKWKWRPSFFFFLFPFFSPFFFLYQRRNRTESRLFTIFWCGIKLDLNSFFAPCLFNLVKKNKGNYNFLALISFFFYWFL